MMGMCKDSFEDLCSVLLAIETRTSSKTRRKCVDSPVASEAGREPRCRLNKSVLSQGQVDQSSLVLPFSLTARRGQPMLCHRREA